MLGLAGFKDSEKGLLEEVLLHLLGVLLLGWLVSLLC